MHLSGTAIYHMNYLQLIMPSISRQKYLICMFEDLIRNEVKCFTSESVDTSPPPFFQFINSIILCLVVWSI